jgi:DNA-binding XRE family transcriptional regulator
MERARSAACFTAQMKPNMHEEFTTPWYRPSYADVPDIAYVGLNELGRWLRELRRDAGMTQYHVEVRSGVDQTVISKLENGRQMSLRLHRLATVIGVLLDPTPRPNRWS